VAITVTIFTNIAFSMAFTRGSALPARMAGFIIALLSLTSTNCRAIRICPFASTLQPQRRVSEPFISSASLHVQLTLSLARNCSYCCHRPVPSDRKYELVRLLNIKPQKSMCNLLARVHRSCLVDGGIGSLRRIHLDVLAKPRGTAPQSRMLTLKNFSTGKLKFETY